MPKAKDIKFIQTRPIGGHPQQFALFRSVDGTLTHVMGGDGMWIALGDDDDKAIVLLQGLIEGHKLPEWRVDDDESFEETNGGEGEPDDSSGGQLQE